jgi:hypothetical protein
MMTASNIVLAGGPDLNVEPGAVPDTVPLEQKVKVPFASGYEHFSHNGEYLWIDGVSRPVFQWCGRTQIAE